jgi:hypothetical protein
MGLVTLGLAVAVSIEWQDQHGKWHQYQDKNNLADAYRVAKNRNSQTRLRHRLVDSDGRLLDIIG